jgi:hypothetical protein
MFDTSLIPKWRLFEVLLVWLAFLLVSVLKVRRRPASPPGGEVTFFCALEPVTYRVRQTADGTCLPLDGRRCSFQFQRKWCKMQKSEETVEDDDFVVRIEEIVVVVAFSERQQRTWSIKVRFTLRSTWYAMQ